VVLLSLFLSWLSRKRKSIDVRPEEAQEQQEASDPLHHLAAAGAGAQVPPEAVPVHRGEGRVLQLPAPDGDAGEDLVPEQKGQSQKTTGGRAGEV